MVSFQKMGRRPAGFRIFQLNSGVSAGLGVHWQVPSRAPDFCDSNIRSSLRNARFY